MPKLSRVALVLVAISCASVLLQVRSGHLLTVPSAAAATAGIGFETPSIADPIHTFGEPDIGIDSQGRVFVSGPTGTGTQRSIWLGSVDGGNSFRTISPGPPPSALAGTEAPPGGGDTDINFDRSGKQYFIDLYALVCDRVATTGGDGEPAIDQVTGKVFQPAGFPNDDGTYDLLLNVGTPDAAGNLTFLDAPALPGGSPDYTKLIHVADGLPDSPDVLFTVASMDAARNLFVAWAVDAGRSNPGQRQVFVSAASAASGWKVWTPPVQVSDGSSATGDAVNVFPWIKAGGAGRADAVWYGSDKKVDPSGNSGQNWNVFMSQVVFPTDSSGAITGAAPSKTLVRVTPHPMHYDSICLAGTGCIASQGNRNLADFFEVNIDRSGAAEIVYDDTSNGLVQPGFTPDNLQLVDHAGAGVVTIARQSSGPGLYGKSVSGPSRAPVGGFSDPAGDARYPVIGGASVAGMDIVGSQLSLSGGTLTVTTKVVDLSNPALTSASLAAPLLHYVTRWQLGNTLYYAAMQNTAANQPTFYAGKTQSVDLCSVSACFPHVLTYPEPDLGGTQEPGTVQCAAVPSAKSPCTITIKVNAADVGSPTAKSLLEEVGAYALATSHPEGATTNAQAQADNVPLEVDGACCFNFQQKR